jgi:pimeloyl-ACP methyl ester carboxylesterase
VKRATFLGIAAGGAVVQAMSNVYPKTVRRVILLDSSARVAPGFWQKVSDYLEEFFPLGLPLRSLSAEFDSRPMLHRIHCPALVLVSASAGVWLEDQAKMIARRIPNAWFAKLKGSSLNHEGVLSEELRSKVKEFLQVPAKRPQKALRAVAG